MQMKRKETLIVVFAALLIAAVGWVWLSPAGLSRAPDVTFKTIDGRTLKLADMRGHPVLVTFWATTCPGCVAEMPHLAALYREMSAKGVKVIGVAMSYDPPNQVVRMAKNRKIPYTIALDINGSVAHAFGDVQLTPTSFLIAPDGRIVQQKIGAINVQHVRHKLQEMLEQNSKQIG